MIISVIAMLAAAQPTCVLTSHGVSCFDASTIRCPPNWKKTRFGCWDGHHTRIVTSVTRRTTTDIVGHRHRQ